MTKETAKRFAPLVQALADGKTIERFDGILWLEEPEPAFTGNPDNYRVAEPPVECWVNVYNSGLRCYHNTEDDAIRGSVGGMNRRAHLVEVRP